VAGIFETLLTGNEFLNNIDVNELAIFDKLEINDFLKVKDMAQFEEISVKSSFKNNLFNITDDNEIIFEDEAVIRIKNSPIAFKAKDIFEVIAFLKFMIKICGKQMEKCDFNNLLKNSLNQQKLDLMKVLKDRYNKNKEDIAKIHAEYKKTLDNNEARIISMNNASKENNNDPSSVAGKAKKNLKSSRNEINQNSSADNIQRLSLTNNFIFKEKISDNNVNDLNKNHTQSIVNKNKSDEHKSEKEIEELLDYEYKFFKENSSVNEFENFYNNGLFQKYLTRYYYE
jgi:hypothetical protein